MQKQTKVWHAIRSAAIALLLLSFAVELRASSHNEVTGASRFFGPWPVDVGGDLPGYLSEVAAANGSGALVVIEGTCLSACTVKMAARNRCVRANAVLWFHSATVASARSPAGNTALLASYPPRVRREVLRRHMLDSAEFDAEHTLTGRELMQLGESECPKDANR